MEVRYIWHICFPFPHVRNDLYFLVSLLWDPLLNISCLLSSCPAIYSININWKPTEKIVTRFLSVQDLYGPVFHLCMSICWPLQLRGSHLHLWRILQCFTTAWVYSSFICGGVVSQARLWQGPDHLLLGVFHGTNTEMRRGKETTLPLVTPRCSHGMCVLPCLRHMYWNEKTLSTMNQAFAQYLLLYVNIGVNDAAEEIGKTSLGLGSHELKLSEFGGKDISLFPIINHDLEERGSRDWIIGEINGMEKPSLPPVLA